MIDFRYHLISIIAVLLALSVGVVLGSGALGGQLLNNLEGSVDALRDRNEQLLDEVSERKQQLEEMQRFATEIEPRLIDSKLEGVDVVLVHVDGMSGGVLDEVRAAIGEAGASVSTRIVLRSKLRLDDETSRDSLALSINSFSGDEKEIQAEAAALIGERLAAAAATGRTGGSAVSAAGMRAEEFLLDLEEQDFIDIDQETDEGGRLVAADATFVILAGNRDEAPFDVASFVRPLATTLGEGAAPVVVAETRESSWGVIPAILDDGDARDAAATVERVDEVSGRIGVILALADVLGGSIEHLGFGSGATAVLPEPSLDAPAP